MNEWMAKDGRCRNIKFIFVILCVCVCVVCFFFCLSHLNKEEEEKKVVLLECHISYYNLMLLLDGIPAISLS